MRITWRLMNQPIPRHRFDLFPRERESLRLAMLWSNGALHACLWTREKIRWMVCWPALLACCARRGGETVFSCPASLPVWLASGRRQNAQVYRKHGDRDERRCDKADGSIQKPTMFRVPWSCTCFQEISPMVDFPGSSTER